MAEFVQYKQISAKLKKRFLVKKPNLSETSEEFYELSRQLRDFKSYSGFCCLAAARCEHNLGNTNSEFYSLIESARLFRDGNDINSAISAYRHAIVICPSTLKDSVYRELAKVLESQRRYIDAGDVYFEAKLFKSSAYAYLYAEQHIMALNAFSKCGQEELDLTDLITIFLVKLAFVELDMATIDVPFTVDDTQCDDMVNLYEYLQSLLLIMNGKPGDVEDLIWNMQPYLNGIQRELIQLIVLHKID